MRNIKILFPIFYILIFPSVVFALKQFPSINASVEYYSQSNENAASVVAVVIPQSLEGSVINGIEIPLTGNRQTIPNPTGVAVLVND
ncbi:hypothetical protein HYV69_01395 [Candidatus Uhrbacteria bacterium]|nr:hypothetical protein [Candidatus Uhrbacteria bacterium]